MSRVINVCAPRDLDFCSSYGLLSGQLIRHLARLGWRVNVSALGRIDYAALPPDIANIAARPYKDAPGAIFIGYPGNYHMHDAPNGPRVGITMFESSRIPQNWVPLLNELDAVIVPTAFCATAFRASGVTVPTHVVPLGIGESFCYRARAANRPFTFLAFLDQGARKGGIVAQQAFVRAFGDDPNYRLVLKSRQGRVKWGFSNPNIDLLAHDMSEAELAALYSECDVMIAANKGEGFGLLPREFAATGGIALATPWGGTADDLDAWGWPLPYMLERAGWEGHRVFAGQDLGEWAKCEPDAVAEVLRHVANNRAAYQAQAPQKAAAAQRLYSWQGFAKGVLAIWQEVTVGNTQRLSALAA